VRWEQEGARRPGVGAMKGGQGWAGLGWASQVSRRGSLRVAGTSPLSPPKRVAQRGKSASQV
jgi:hypothetical protein